MLELLVPKEGHLSAGLLSTSVILRIFSFLPNRDLCAASQVCKLWKDLSHHSFCWKDRTAGPVHQREVKQWMNGMKICFLFVFFFFLPLKPFSRPEIASSKVLVPTGFNKIVAFLEVDKERDEQVVGLWKRALALIELNESKVVVTRAPVSSGGGMQFSKFSAAK